MRVFVDTSALIALLDSDDQDHAAVRHALHDLVATDERVVTTSYVLVETGALVRKRLGMSAFRALGDAVEQAFEVIWIEAPLHRLAWRHAGIEGRKGSSLVDWTSFLVMDAEGLTTALTLDGHFADRGYQVLPGPT